MSVFNLNNIPEEWNAQNDKPLIMIIDDEVENINVLRQLLDSKFQIMTSLNGREALDLLDDMDDPESVQLIISDQRMPEVTGLEFFVEIIEKMPDTIRIILTGFVDTQVIIDSINKAKLYEFITKPFEPEELALTVQRGIEAYQMRKKLLDYTLSLEEMVEDRTSELVDKNVELQKALAEVKTLKDVLPICSYCKKIRDDKDSWEQMESYISSHSDTKFSHGICPECAVKVRSEWGLDNKK